MANQILRKPTIAVTPEQYKLLAQKIKPKPTIIKNIVRAFVVGGIICAIGQLIINLFVNLGLARIEASTAATATMIFIGALFTGLGIYDEIGNFAGAGSIIPITGFANSIVAPAMEFQREGYVLGVGAKLFTVAGPVLVYGITTSIVVGIIYFILH
jgi:stage V sporulation protein AC